MSRSIEVLGTIRVGQLTGTTDLDEPEPNQKWTLLVDAEHWPLLTDTGRWDAIGVDLGAATEHNGRLYIFFGDVATKHSGIPLNAVSGILWGLIMFLPRRFERLDDPRWLQHASGVDHVLPRRTTPCGRMQGERAGCRNFARLTTGQWGHTLPHR